MEKTFTAPLITWYHHNKRILPFRLQADPYAIWVSEIMAQQTQIATMLPYYQKWMEDFPTIQKLADASEQEVLKHWEGLGYYSRARNLHKGAQLIVTEMGGTFPEEKDRILSIPGIGDYSSAAINSIAFHQPDIAIDGNVIRVYARFFADKNDFTKNKARQTIKQTLLTYQADTDPSDFTQALMELGALICTPKQAKCEECPLRNHCQAYRSHDVYTYPHAKKALVKTTETYNTFVCMTETGILIDTSPADSLMKGLYRLPQLPIDEPIPFTHYTKIGETKQIFSHKIWQLTLFKVSEYKEKKWQFISFQELELHPLITIHKKILQSLI